MHAELTIDHGQAVGELVEQIAAVIWSSLADPDCPEPLDESTRTAVHMVVCEELWRMLKTPEGEAPCRLPWDTGLDGTGTDWAAELVFRVAEGLRPMISDRRVFEYMADELPEAVAETARLLSVPGLVDHWGLEAWAESEGWSA